MRIIGGKMRGTKLYTLDGFDTTRPTLDRVKESLFNIISVRLVDSRVLDLFAGSGALGLESISRGASTVYLCDESRKAINIIKQNIEKTKTLNQVCLYNKKSKVLLKELCEQNIKFDIVFLDPPYETDLAEESAIYIINNNLLEDDGIIVIETDNPVKVEEGLCDKKIEIYDIRKYGRVSLIFLKRKG